MAGTRPLTSALVILSVSNQAELLTQATDGSVFSLLRVFILLMSTNKLAPFRELENLRDPAIITF